MNAISLSPETILDHYPLSGPLHQVEIAHKKVAFHLIDAKSEQIARKYNINVYEFLTQKCNFQTRTWVILKTCGVEAETVLKVVAKATFIGGSIGFLVGGAAGLMVGIVTKNVVLGVKLAAGGTTAGAAIGGTVGAIMGIKCARQNFSVRIAQGTEFAEWKNGVTKEQYELFLNFIKNYSIEIEENEANQVDLQALGKMPSARSRRIFPSFQYILPMVMYMTKKQLKNT